MKREIEVTTIEADGRDRFERVLAQFLNAAPPNSYTTAWSLAGFATSVDGDRLPLWCAVLTRRIES